MAEIKKTTGPDGKQSAFLALIGIVLMDAVLGWTQPSAAVRSEISNDTRKFIALTNFVEI